MIRRSRLRSDGVRRRLTNKKRPSNKSLIFSCMDLLLRAKRRAAFSLDDGRPRFNLGLAVAKRLRSDGHGTEDPFDQFRDDMEGAKLMGHLPKDLADRFRIEAEPSVVIPLSAKARSSKAVFKRQRKR